jgi:hypothetical protein
MVNDGRSLGEITDALEKEFRLPRTQFLVDVSDFLSDWRKCDSSVKTPPAQTREDFLSRLLSRSRSV